MTKGAYISPAITDPALKETLLSFADEIEASGLTIANVDPDASLKARGGRLYYNAATDNLFIFSDDTGNYQPVSAGEEKTYHTVRIYWQRESSAGSTIPAGPPVVTLTWANLTQASTNAAYKGGLVLDSSSPSYALADANISANGNTAANAEGRWSENPPLGFNNSVFTIYWSDLTFQRTGAEATTTSTGTEPVKHIHFDGLVIFSNSLGDPISKINNVTKINGDYLKTGTIDADEINVRELNTETLKNNSITHVSGFSQTPTNLGTSDFNNDKTFNIKANTSFSFFFNIIVQIFGAGNANATIQLEGFYSVNGGGNYISFPVNVSTNSSDVIGARTLAIAGGTAVTGGSNVSSSTGTVILRLRISNISNIGNQGSGAAPQYAAVYQMGVQYK